MKKPKENQVECARCWRTIDTADSDVLYLDGYPVCPICFNEFWERLNKMDPIYRDSYKEAYCG